MPRWWLQQLCMRVRFQISQKRTPAVSELGCECCIKMNLELSEAVSELKSSKEIIRILNEDLDMANLSELNASNPSNLNRQKDQIYFQTIPSNWNKITARHPASNRRSGDTPESNCKDIKFF